MHLRRSGADVDSVTTRRLRGELVRAHFAAAAAAHPDIDMRAVYRELVELLLPGHPDPGLVADEAAWVFRLAATEYRTVYPRAHAALDMLGARFRLAVASNTQRVYTARELDAGDLTRHFESITFSSDVGRVKPHPCLLERALEDLGVAAHDAIYIGDNPIDDYVAATAAGMRCILIRHDGRRDLGELGVPQGTAVVTGFDELVELLEAST